MRPELRREVLRILEALNKGEWQAAIRRAGRSELEFEAIDYIESSGLIAAQRNRPPFMNATGYEFLQEANASWMYRFMKNWSELIIPVVAAVLGAATGSLITFFLTR